MGQRESAGGSARQRYEQLRSREVAAQRVHLPVALALALATPLVVYALVRIGADRLNSLSAGPTSSTVPIPEGQAHAYGIVLAICATIGIAASLWGRRQSTEAWGIGAAGEDETARLLDPLEDDGYVILHDRRKPGGGNIDHIVVGPTGVFVIETKSWSGKVTIGSSAIRRNGRSADAAISQGNREAAAVEAALARHHTTSRLPVQAVLCIHRADVTLSSRSTRSILDGVRICSPRRLRSTVQEGTSTLGKHEVAAIAKLLDSTFRSAAQGAGVPMHQPASSHSSLDSRLCACGGQLVLRHRRRDGAPFLGCSRFPACRHTEPAVPAENHS